MALCMLADDLVNNCPEGMEAIRRICTSVEFIGIRMSFHGTYHLYRLDGEELPVGDVNVSFVIDTFPGIDPFITEILE